jgi:membrane protein YdbS with pleckstrin-like domain
MITRDIPLKLPASALVYEMIKSVILVGVLFAFSLFFPQADPYRVMGGLLLIIYCFAYNVVYWKLFSYQVSAAEVAISSGVLFRSSKSVAYNRLQNVDIKRGPLLMACGLAEIQGFTASPAQVIVSSSRNSGSTTTITPDIRLVIGAQDAQELSGLMQAGNVQKVQAVTV